MGWASDAWTWPNIEMRNSGSSPWYELFKTPARIQNPSDPIFSHSLCPSLREREREERNGDGERGREAIEAKNREDSGRNSSLLRHSQPETEGALSPPITIFVPTPVLLRLLQNPNPALHCPAARCLHRARRTLRLHIRQRLRRFRCFPRGVPQVPPRRRRCRQQDRQVPRLPDGFRGTCGC